MDFVPINYFLRIGLRIFLLLEFPINSKSIHPKENSNHYSRTIFTLNYFIFDRMIIEIVSIPPLISDLNEIEIVNSSQRKYTLSFREIMIDSDMFIFFD
jgi:hypothetical protein